MPAVLSLAASASPLELTYAPGIDDPHVGMNVWRVYDGGDLVEQVNRMHAAGYRQVNLIPRAHADGRWSDDVGGFVVTGLPTLNDPANTNVGFDDAELRAAIARGKALGMHVSVTPHLTTPGNAVGRDRMQLNVAGATDRAGFFNAYGDLLEGWATIAQQEGADRFNVGSELTGLAGDARNADGWGEVIDRVDAAFDGRIGYQELQFAFDNEAVRAIWSRDAIDYVSISGYLEVEQRGPSYDPPAEVYEIQQPDDVAFAQLIADFVGHPDADLGAMQATARAIGKPLILEELGTTAVNGASGQPYRWDLTGASDPAEMLLWYQGVLSVFDGRYGTGAGEIERVNLWTWAWEGGYVGEPFDLGPNLPEGHANALASDFLSSYVSQAVTVPEPVGATAALVLPGLLLRRRRPGGERVAAVA